jgi:hypothetical protein
MVLNSDMSSHQNDYDVVIFNILWNTRFNLMIKSVSFMEEMKGLIRIICLDAHIPGKLMEIKVGKHANLSGTNGAGKTTLLKLVPFFYGASSSQIVQKVGKRKTFVNFYLPRPTSLIVFEYKTERGLMCVVVYRHSSGDKPAYRFLSEPFNIEYFSEIRSGELVYIEGKSLSRHWTISQLQHSKQLESVTDYRAVIQGDRSLINRSGQSRELIPLVAMFSITGRIGGMRYIDKMANAILGRSGDMNRIKEMLADIMREDGITLPPIHLHKNVRETMAELTILRDMERHNDDFNSVISKGTSYIENSSRLDFVYAELLLVKKALAEQLAKAEDELTELNSELKVLKAKWEDQELNLQSEVTATKADRDLADNQLQRLTDEKERWEKLDIAEKSTEYQQLSNIVQLMVSAQERLNTLEEGVKDLRVNHDKRKYMERERHSKFVQELNSFVASLKSELAEAGAEWQAKQLSLEKKFSAEKEALRKESQVELDLLTTQIAETQLHASNILPTEEEKLEQLQAEEARELASEVNEAAVIKHRQAQKVVSNIKILMIDTESLVKKARRAKEQEIKERERLLVLCNPKPGSLLSDFREQDPDWHESIGRLICSDLLERKDLSPKYVEQVASERTLLGWSLDLNKLEKPSWASTQEEQEALLSSQEDKLDLAERHESNCHDQYRKKANEFHQEKLVVEECERAVSQAFQQQQSAIEALKLVKLRNQEAANVRKLAAKVRLARLEKEQLSTQSNIRRDVDAIEVRYRGSFNEAMGIAKLEEARVQENIDQYERAEEEEKANHLKIVLTLDEDFKALCSEQGLDEVVLKDAENNLRKAKDKVDLVRSYREDVTNYRDWISRHWSQKTLYVERLEQAHQAFDTSSLRLKQAKTYYRMTRDENNNKRELLDYSLRSLKEGYQECIANLSQLPQPLNPLFLEAARSQVLIITECTTLLSSQQQLRRDIKTGINRAESIICKGGDKNQIAEAWAELCKQEQNKLLDPNNLDGLTINLTLALEELINVQLPQKRQALALFVETIGGQLTDFYLGLKGVSGAIKNQSRQISSSICSTMHFDAISDIQVALISRVDSQDYWPALEEFYRIWKDWKDDGDSGIPPKEVDSQLIIATDILHRSQLSKGIESVFDLEISLRENDRPVSVTRNADLENVSSTGLSYLILCSIFAGITRMLCRDDSVKIHWPMDELGTLASENISKLFVMLDQHNIIMVGGFPTTDPLLLQHFKEHHEVKKGVGIIELVLPEDKLASIMAKKQQQHELAVLAE